MESLVSFSTSKRYIWGMELKYETIQLEHEQGNESQQLGGRPSLSPSIHRVSLPINLHLGCWWFCLNQGDAGLRRQEERTFEGKCVFCNLSW